jgi:hypothetical protein
VYGLVIIGLIGLLSTDSENCVKQKYEHRTFSTNQNFIDLCTIPKPGMNQLNFNSILRSTSTLKLTFKKFNIFSPFSVIVFLILLSSIWFIVHVVLLIGIRKVYCDTFLVRFLFVNY